MKYDPDGKGLAAIYTVEALRSVSDFILSRPEEDKAWWALADTIKKALHANFDDPPDESKIN